MHVFRKSEQDFANKQALRFFMLNFPQHYLIWAQNTINYSITLHWDFSQHYLICAQNTINYSITLHWDFSQHYLIWAQNTINYFITLHWDFSQHYLICAQNTINYSITLHWDFSQHFLGEYLSKGNKCGVGEVSSSQALQFLREIWFFACCSVCLLERSGLHWCTAYHISSPSEVLRCRDEVLYCSARL